MAANGYFPQRIGEELHDNLVRGSQAIGLSQRDLADLIKRMLHREINSPIGLLSAYQDTGNQLGLSMEQLRLVHHVLVTFYGMELPELSVLPHNDFPACAVGV